MSDENIILHGFSAKFKLVLRSFYYFDKINKDPYIHVTGTG